MWRLLIIGILFQILHPSLLGQENESSGQEELEPGAKTESQGDGDLSSYVLVEEEADGLVSSQEVRMMRMPSSVDLLPVSVGVVSERLFNFQGAEVLGQALKNVSGTLSQTGFGVFDFFVIRGFDSLSSGLVLIDGAREPEVTFYHLYNVHRVEVLKGPGGFLYGGNPLAGSVNLARKEPVFEPVSRVWGSLGSFRTIRGSIDLNRVNSAGSCAFRLNTFGSRSDSYRDDKRNWQAAVNPAASFQWGEKSFLTVNFEYVRNEYQSDSGIPLFNDQIADVPRTRSYQSPFDASDQNIFRARVDFSRALGRSALLRNKFYYTDLEWRSDGTIFPAVLPNQQSGVGVYRSLLRLDDRQRLFGNQTDVLFRFDTGRVRHELLTGFEVSRLGDRFTLDLAALPPIDLYVPKETAALPLYNLPDLAQAGDTRNWVFAPYLLDQMFLSERLRLLGGGRLDEIDFENSLSGLERGSRNFSPILGLSYSLFPGLTLYGNAGQAFAPPSSRVVGEQDPEESIQFEVGYKKRFGNTAFLTMAVFELTRKNIGIPDETGLVRQQGDQRSRGIEFDLTGQVTDGLFLFASYAFTHAELTRFTELVDYSFGQSPPALVDRSGNRSSFAPDHILKSLLIKELASGLSLGIGARYVSRQFIAEDNVFAIDGSLIFDAAISYRRDDWNLSLNLRNLTSTQYETRGFGSTSVIPGDPFAVYLGVEFIQ